MISEKILQRFAKDRVAGRGSLLPYFTAGYPNSDIVGELVRRASGLGAAAVEIGFPFSDSIADGPMIQESFHEALSRGLKVRDTLEFVARVRSEVECALLAMVSSSIVHRIGEKAFMIQASASGFDGVILPDVPLEESAAMREAAQEAGLCYVGLVAPAAPLHRRTSIARGSTGFIYQVAVAGTTGERSVLPPSLSEEIAGLRGVTQLPLCVGFGISTPDQVREVCGLCDGAIVGSALIRRIHEAEQAGAKGGALVEAVSTLLSELLSGTVLKGGYGVRGPLAASATGRGGDPLDGPPT